MFVRMPSSGPFLRQLNAREAWRSTSNRWTWNKNRYYTSGGGGCEKSLDQMEGFAMYEDENNSNGTTVRKRVMVVVDDTAHSKHAMIWALSHVANKADLLTLLHVVPSRGGQKLHRKGRRII